MAGAAEHGTYSVIVTAVIRAEVTLLASLRRMHQPRKVECNARGKQRAPRQDHCLHKHKRCTGDIVCCRGQFHRLGLGSFPSVQTRSCRCAGAYAISPVVERASSAQHLQLASGCPPAAYWAGSFAWDMTSHLAVTLLSLAIFAAYGDQAAIGSLDQVHCGVAASGSSGDRGCPPKKSNARLLSKIISPSAQRRVLSQALGSFTLLMAYGAAVIPLAYACAFGFSSHSAAQVCSP